MKASSACQGELCNDKWHYISLGTIVKDYKDPRLNANDNWEDISQPNSALEELIGDEVSRLIRRGHIAVRYKTVARSSTIFFRIYIGASVAHGTKPLSSRTDAGKTTRTCWNLLLGSISRQLSDWYAGDGPNDDAAWPFSIDERNLSEIFTDLDPPSPRQAFIDEIKDIDCHLKYPLYLFQRSTVATMLEREAKKAMLPDPTFVPLKSLDPNSMHREFWIQPSTMRVVTEPHFYTTAESGGILSEEMGAGKTVILLALILATRGQLSRPEELETSGVLTSLSLRTHQSPYHRQLRQTYSLAESEQMPTLVETVLHHLSVNPQAVTCANSKVARAFESSLFGRTFRFIRPFILESDTNKRGVVKPDKKQVHPVPVYLSRSTLVVVPSSLFEQWKGEFYKFCADGSLNALFINTSKEKIPRPQELVTFDLVLTTMEWLGASNRMSSVTGRVDLCQCPGDSILRNVPLCNCTEVPSINPIFLCRWRRLIVDEGHTSANLTTEYTVAASKLSVEHRWLVTGTPTRHLIGSIAVPRSILPTDMTPAVGNRNESEDEKDMQRLSRMIGRYLRIEPFFSQRKYFEDHISLALRNDWRGTKAVLQAALQQVMIRHPIEVVDSEVCLPPMTKETVLLRLEPMQAQTYNFIQSTIAVNAVDSERVDQDYIFHPKNKELVPATFANLSQSLFWHADQDFFDKELESHLHNSRSSIQRAKEKGNITTEDSELLKQANYIQEMAAVDDIWRATMRREDIPYLTIGVPDEIQGAFSRYEPDVQLHHSDRLLKLREAVYNNANIDSSELLQLGEKTQQEDIIKEAIIQSDKVRASKKWRKPTTNQQAGQTKARTIVKERGSSPLFGSNIVRSCSSKLNYVIQEILTYGEDEKFLIFSSSLLSLMHSADALQLANVAFLEYTSECTSNQRRVNIAQFNNMSMYRVFLMELKHGARGLNLVAASRVIFLEPVWAPDVEAQAIKRVHRTGQTRPVVVKTLAIRDTVEEEMLGRRAAVVAKTSKMPALTEEAGMRSYIANPRFLLESGSDITWTLPLVPVRNPRKQGLATQVPMDLDPTDVTTMHKRKRSVDLEDKPGKRVRFLSPGVDMELYEKAPEALESEVNRG